MIELSINRPSLLVVFFSILGVLGVVSYNSLSYELMPKFSSPILTITTFYPGASPSEVENSVTKELEDAISTLEKITDIRSTSIESFSIVLVQFEQDAKVDMLVQDAQRKLDAILAKLPDDADSPVISKFSADDFPIMSIGVTSTESSGNFYDLMEDRIKPLLSSITGVGEVNLLGGQEKEIRVNVKKDKMEQYGISILQVVQAVRAANLDFPTGKIKNDNRQILIRLAGKFQSLDDLRQLVVTTNRNGVPVRLYEIAEIQDTQKEIVDLNRVDMKSSIGISIVKQTDANAVDVSESILNKLKELEEQYADINLEFSVSRDASDFTLEAVNAVQYDLMLAIILVALVMLFFLHSFRNALIVMVAIPASLVSAVIAMYVLDYTFNLMTLLAMSLVIGILVDDSIVVLENIFRHLEMGKSRKQAAIDGSKEIFITALSITAVLVVVFLPLVITGGIVGNILRQFSVVVAISTALSLLVSYTLAPALAAYFSRLETFKEKSIGGFIFGNFEKGIRRLSNAYGGWLAWTLKHKTITLAVIVGLFLSSFLLVTKGYIGTSFINSGDRGEFIVQLELAKDATVLETNRACQIAEEHLLSHPDITGIFTMVGRKTGMISGGQKSPNLSEMVIKLKDKNERDVSTATFAVQMRNELEAILPGVEVASSEVSFMGGANDAPVQVVIGNTDYQTAIDYSKRVLEKLQTIEGALEAELSLEEGNPEIKVEVDRSRQAELGLNIGTVGATLQTAFSGNTDSQFRRDGKEYDINIRFDAFDRNDPSDIATLSLMNNKGKLVRLNQFATIEQTTGPARLERLNRIPAVTVNSKVLGKPSGTIGAEIKQWIAENPPPPGTVITYDGDLRRQSDSFGSLGTAFLVSFIFVYLILVALYDSYAYPFVVMFSIPVGLCGALLALALTMESLNIFSILGIIMLNGLVSKNAILLVDFANQAKREGLKTGKALVQAGIVRLRPILMTTLALVVGMTPIALASGPGSEWKNGLAWALIGGLISSMILTLFLVPVLYQIVDNIKDFFNRQNKKKENNERSTSTSVRYPETNPISDEI